MRGLQEPSRFHGNDISVVAKVGDKSNWLDFFYIYENKNNLSKIEYNDQVNRIMKKTSDKNLIKLLKLHLNL